MTGPMTGAGRFCAPAGVPWPPGARLLIIERLMPERLEPSAENRALARVDLHMLVALGAQERTQKRNADAAGSAGFDARCGESRPNRNSRFSRRRSEGEGGLQVWALRDNPGTVARSAEICWLTCCSIARRSRTSFVLRDAARVARGVQRRHHAAAVIEHRHRQRDDAVGELVLDRGVAAAAALLDERAQLRRIGHRALGERLERGGLESSAPGAPGSRPPAARDRWRWHGRESGCPHGLQGAAACAPKCAPRRRSRCRPGRTARRNRPCCAPVPPGGSW